MCYGMMMRAFIGTVGRSGLLGLIAEDVAPPDAWRLCASEQFPRPTSTVWALLHDQDAELIRSEVGAGRHEEACGLLLNRAVELLTLASATSWLASGDSP